MARHPGTTRTTLNGNAPTSDKRLEGRGGRDVNDIYSKNLNPPDEDELRPPLRVWVEGTVTLAPHEAERYEWVAHLQIYARLLGLSPQDQRVPKNDDGIGLRKYARRSAEKYSANETAAFIAMNPGLTAIEILTRMYSNTIEPKMVEPRVRAILRLLLQNRRIKRRFDDSGIGRYFPAEENTADYATPEVIAIADCMRFAAGTKDYRPYITAARIVFELTNTCHGQNAITWDKKRAEVQGLAEGLPF